ncbi:MAG: glycoside hydrolase family 30 protein [Candidatus Krumholzibacteriota bacterium]|nr:glycoside hydrolase family 30 protein [Candidatus Krumholzibacteriota bacterium]
MIRLFSPVLLTAFCVRSACIINPGCSARVDYTARIVQTSRAGDKASEKQSVPFRPENASGLPVIRLDPEKRYQEIAGFGGSFTESSAWVLSRLSDTKRQEVLRAYFSPDEAAYSLTRTHIGSCDFSLSNYTYAVTPGDLELSDFSIDEDRDDLIPLILDAAAVEGADFRIVASAWTAPPWMKDNNGWNGGSLLAEYYDTWALFFCRYIEEYERAGIPIWAVTTLNEPLGNSEQWESMIFTPAQIARFVKNNLGPRFAEAGIDTRILIYDQNRDHLEEWANVILGDQDAAKYIWGTAVHWYSSTYEWYPEELSRIHERFPGKKLLHTEGCIDSEVPVWRDDDWYWRPEATDWGYYWATEEDKHLHPEYVPVYRYARDIIGGLNSYLTGWIDWNIVLDDRGGPNHAENWCIAPVIANPAADEVYYTPLYYVMRHFSRYIRPGAVRIGVENGAEGLMVTAVRNTGGTIAVEILNQADQSKRFSLELGSRFVEISIPACALQTIIIE